MAKKNRIAIINWRGYRDDESYCKVQAFAKGDRTSLLKIIEKEYRADNNLAVNHPLNKDEVYGYYVNDDLEIVDGETFETPDGRTLRVTITDTSRPCPLLQFLEDQFQSIANKRSANRSDWVALAKAVQRHFGVEEPQ